MGHLTGNDGVRNNLLFSKRPPEVQQRIDKVYNNLVTQNPSWGYGGNSGFYEILGFPDNQVIAQRIKQANPSKQDLYFLDLGSGHFAWVDSVKQYLAENYANSTIRFHVIGVSGEGKLNVLMMGPKMKKNA